MKPNVQYLLECYVGDKLFETCMEQSTEDDEYFAQAYAASDKERSTEDYEYYTQAFEGPGNQPYKKFLVAPCHEQSSLKECPLDARPKLIFESPHAIQLADINIAASDKERSTEDYEYYTRPGNQLYKKFLVAPCHEQSLKECVLDARSKFILESPRVDLQAADINIAGDEVREIQEANARIYGIYAVLNARQRQEIRHLARTLRTTADSFPIRPLRALLAVENAILQNERLDRDELQVVNNMHSIKTTTTISTIAGYLGEKLTSRTFRAALRFISYSASSVPEELALVCELAKETWPKIQQLARSDSIYDEISEFIEDKLNVIIH